jgi:hypothetical protein
MGSFDSAAPDDDEQLVVDCLITPSDGFMCLYHLDECAAMTSNSGFCFLRLMSVHRQYQQLLARCVFRPAIEFRAQSLPLLRGYHSPCNQFEV